MAAITDYGTLKTEVAAWVNRSDLTAVVPGLIQLAETRIYRELRVRQMETALSEAIASGVVALPSGYLELKHAYVDGTTAQPLGRKDAAWIYANYPPRSSDGKPLFIAREASNFIFGPYPDDAYTVKGVYYKKLDALSESNATNWLITDAPDLILYASLLEASPYLGADSRIPVWQGAYELSKAAIQRQDEREEFSGSVLQITAR